ncbi:MAG: energy transducer TonB [Acidobacteria bacterium]|nr:MAG: energy transducer TonB [Acidobacteriota bacterium]
MPIIDTQVGPARSHSNNGSSNSTREDFTFTIPESPGLLSSLRENLREWRRTSRLRVPAGYARDEAVLPVTEMRPWYRDFGKQIGSLFEKPTDPIGIFNRRQEKKRAACGLAVAIAGGGFAYWLTGQNFLADPKMIALGAIGGYVVGETLGIFAFKKREYPPDIWQDYQLQRASWVNSVLVHAVVILALILPYYISQMLHPMKSNVQVTDISPLLLQMPPSANKAGGGGGGGARTPTPPSKGKAPLFSKTQMAPPEVTIPKVQPILPVKPTIIGPPEMKLPDMAQNAQFGDPLQGVPGPPSTGPGFGGGIGTGQGTGVGSGQGGGFGPGQGGGAGGGLFSVGGNVSAPIPIYKPEPPYSEQARKAKYQGTVVLWIVVDAAGNVTDAQVVKPLGMGLDQNAVTTVKTWKFKPAMRNGGPVPVKVMVEVSFRLF